MPCAGRTTARRVSHRCLSGGIFFLCLFAVNQRKSIVSKTRTTPSAPDASRPAERISAATLGLGVVAYGCISRWKRDVL